jgi:acetolactate synthase-1/2/3 large subunit
MMRMTGAEIVIGALERQGVSVVAGIPGGANLPLYDALARAGSIRHVLARHEQGAAFMAQGIARSTGRAGVCLATSGPGATNLLTAIADAKLDSVPIVCITAQVPRALAGTEAFQEVDICAMAAPAAKRTYAVRSANELPALVPEAFRTALSGRPGPVLVDIPKDVLTETAEFASWHEPGGREPDAPPSLADIARAIDLIDRAERPVMIVGGGVVRAGAGWRAQRLAERAGIPVASTLMGLGALPAGHPLSVGMLGMHGTRAANLAVRKSDLVIALGVRFGDRTTGRLASFCPRAEVIHVNADAAELDRIVRADVAIAADAGDVLAELVRAAPRTRRGWRQQVARLAQTTPPAADKSCGRADPGSIVRAVARAAGRTAIVATDVGQHQMWVAQQYPHDPAGAWLTSGGLGTMGFGLPAAIGAALANPGRTVVCFSGDGSLLMNVQELATAADVRANVKVVLFDNGLLGLVCQQQDLFYGGRRCASEFEHRTEYVALAAAFGIESCDLARAADPDAALRDVLGRPGPALIRVPVTSAERVFPMVPPGAANAEMISARGVRGAASGSRVAASPRA